MKEYSTFTITILMTPTFLGVGYYRSTGVGRAVMVIVIENGHGDSSSNPRRDFLRFT